jgi:Protein of unknown function (DUF4058)
MPSPFPGMDPYLESHWRDIHASLVIYARDALQAVLPAPLRARVEERVLLEAPNGLGDHPLFPDVRVVEYKRKRHGKAAAQAGVAVAEPLLVDAPVEPISETFLEIIDRDSGNRVVTIIEFLSPSNKSPGPDREQYLWKQQENCNSEANLVEIDLNRFGVHTHSRWRTSSPRPARRTLFASGVPRVATKRRSIPWRCAIGCQASAYRFARLTGMWRSTYRRWWIGATRTARMRERSTTPASLTLRCGRPKKSGLIGGFDKRDCGRDGGRRAGAARHGDDVVSGATMRADR